MSVAFALIARTQEVGGRTLVDAVKPDLGAHTHGRLYQNGMVYWESDKVTGPHGRELQARFEQELFAELERIDPGVVQRALGAQAG